MRRPDGSMGRYGFALSPFLTPAFTYLWQNGGDVLSVDASVSTAASPEAVEAVRFMASLVDVDAVVPKLGAGDGPDALTPAFGEGGPTVGGVPVAMAPFTYGSAFGMQMTTNRSQSGGNVEVDVKVEVRVDERGRALVGPRSGSSATATLPRNKQAAGLAAPAGMIAVLAASVDPEASWFAAKELARAVERFGTVPARRVGEAELMQRDPSLDAGQARAVLEAAGRARSPLWPRKYELMTVLRDVVDVPVLRGGADPAAVLEEASNRIDRLLQG